METFFETHRNSLIAIAVAIVAALSTMVVVPETEEAVIIQAGRPDRVANRFKPDVPYGETGAGIVMRIPFYERVERIDKRVLNVDMEPQTVLSTDQLRLNVDAYARYRIIDPVRMVQTAGTLATVDSQLSAVLSSVVRQELGRRSFASLLTAERGTTMANIRTKLDAQARKYGAQVIDVRIKRADLPDGSPLESAFRRMQSARKQEADTLRAQGLKNAQIIRAEAEAQAAKIYADAYGKDPEFYDFYRAMQSYDTTFAPDSKSGSSIILSPDNEYLKQFRGRR
ncbi:Modulator of FtsH protease HflC [Tsuneonella dongtanensis]|uniref:Protein HflC n=1 Tax=Tsuneonella dongtanensis TaxID=692370 RepID=A0A1B2A9A4_9SPHN|nr:protease modulator HflC [Tsuneonella dongtanensis]ANY18691.1 Modulator of FtsH protease HflC [Tsuneonella dongtanensis]